MTDMNLQKEIKKSTFGKNMTFKKLELGFCDPQDQCPRPLSYDDVQENRPIYSGAMLIFYFSMI